MRRIFFWSYFLGALAHGVYHIAVVELISCILLLIYYLGISDARMREATIRSAYRNLVESLIRSRKQSVADFLRTHKFEYVEDDSNSGSPAGER